MTAFVSSLRAQPLLRRCALVGMIVAGVAGAITGLVVGLNVYPQTAWAAILELGIPATIAGGTLGFVIGCIIALASHLRNHRSA